MRQQGSLGRWISQVVGCTQRSSLPDRLEAVGSAEAGLEAQPVGTSLDSGAVEASPALGLLRVYSG
jgi:hypothetical protein